VLRYLEEIYPTTPLLGATPPDGQHHADRRAVFQNESSHNARIDREIGIAVLFARCEIDGDKRHGDSLFGKEHPHAPRIVTRARDTA